MDQIPRNHHRPIRVIVNVYAGRDPVVDRKVDQIVALLQTLTRGSKLMTKELDTLIERVTAIESVGDSAVVLLNELKAELDAAIAADDAAALQELSDRLGAQAQELADAIVANTPVAPAEPQG